MVKRKGKARASVFTPGKSYGKGLHPPLPRQLQDAEEGAFGKHYTPGKMQIIDPDGKELTIDSQKDPEAWADWLRTAAQTHEGTQFRKVNAPGRSGPNGRPQKPLVPPMSNKYPSRVALRGLPPNVSEMYERRAHQALWCYTRDAAMGFHHMADLFRNGGVQASEDALRLTYYKTCINPNAWWVSKDITRGLVDASVGLENYTLEAELFSEGVGYVWFEGGIPPEDVPMPKALGWAQDVNRVFEHQIDAPLVGFSWFREGDRIIFYIQADMSSGPRFPGTDMRSNRDVMGVMGYAFLLGSTLTTMIDSMRHDAYLPEEENGDLRRLRLIGTFLLWCKQRILVEGGRSVPDRAARRRVDGLHKPGEGRIDIQEIKIVTLRSQTRKPSPKEEGERREYNCQWIVRGFWRNQWYPSKQIHQSIYVDSFVKGPADKPLRIPRQTLFAVTR